MNSINQASRQHDTDQPGHGRSRGRRGRRGDIDGSPTGHGHDSRRHRHGGFGPEGFGPRGGRGQHLERGFGFGGPRGRRARKGDVRATILSQLARSNANGYALIQAIADQSNGAWKPSPGSVYPTLAQLVDEGLIVPVDTVAPRSDYRLTEAGRTYVSEHSDELAATWNGLGEAAPMDATGELFESTAKLMGVLRQYASEATDEQKKAGAAKLDELRREFYRTLAE